MLPGVISSGLQTKDPLPYTPSIYPAGAPAGFTAAYPALSFWLPTPRFWLSTPASYPAPTSQLITRRPLEWSANTRPIVTLYPKHLPGRYTRWGSRQLTRLQPPNLLPSVLSSGLQMQDPLPYTPSIYPAGASAGVHGGLLGSELLAPDSRLVTRLQDLTLNSSWLPGVLSSGLQMQDLLPYPPSIYPAGAPAGVHGGLPGSEILAQILAQILALNSSWLPGSNLPTCYPASPRVVCKRKAHYLIPRALTRLVRPLGFTAAYSAPNFWLPTPDWLPGSDLPTSQTKCFKSRTRAYPACPSSA